MPKLTVLCFPQMPLKLALLLQLTQPPSPRHSHAFRHPLSIRPVPRSAASVMGTPASYGESPGSWGGLLHLVLSLYSLRESPPWRSGYLDHLQEWHLVPTSQILLLVFRGPPQCWVYLFYPCEAGMKARDRARIQTLGRRWLVGVVARPPLAAPYFTQGA